MNKTFDLTKLVAGSYFQHPVFKYRLCFTGSEFYLQTTKPNANDPEAFVAWLSKDFVEENSTWFKHFEPRLYSENERTWFLSRYPKLAKVDENSLACEEDGRIVTLSEVSDFRIDHVKALNLTRINTEGDLKTQVSKLSPEQKAELAALLASD